MQADQGETNDGCTFLCLQISLYPTVEARGGVAERAGEVKASSQLPIRLKRTVVTTCGVRVP